MNGMKGPSDSGMVCESKLLILRTNKTRPGALPGLVKPTHLTYGRHFNQTSYTGSLPSSHTIVPFWRNSLPNLSVRFFA